MRTFKVTVSHEDREVVKRALEALANANFIVGGPPGTGPPDPADPAYDDPIHHEVVVGGLKARDGADARKRVQDAIPPDAGYRFEITEE